MDMKFRYEKPILIDLREDMFLQGHFMQQRNGGVLQPRIGYHRNGDGWRQLL